MSLVRAGVYKTQAENTAITTPVNDASPDDAVITKKYFIDNTAQRLATMEQKLAAMKQDIEARCNVMDGKITKCAQDIEAFYTTLSNTVDTRINALRNELNTNINNQINALRAEMTQLINNTAGSVRALIPGA